MGMFYGLSSIDQSTTEQGAKGANMIIDILESDDEKQLNNFEQLNIWPIDLIVRSSTARRSAK